MVHILLHVPFPVRIDHHGGSSLRDTCLGRIVVRLSNRVGTWHRFTTIKALVTGWRHNLIYTIELDLVLLVQWVEIETDLTVVGRLDNWLIDKAVDRVLIGLARDLTSWECRTLRYLTDTMRISTTWLGADVSCVRLQCNLGIDLLRRGDFLANIRALSLLGICWLVNVLATSSGLLLTITSGGPSTSISMVDRCGSIWKLGLNAELVWLIYCLIVTSWLSLLLTLFQAINNFPQILWHQHKSALIWFIDLLVPNARQDLLKDGKSG